MAKFLRGSWPVPCQLCFFSAPHSLKVPTVYIRYSAALQESPVSLSRSLSLCSDRSGEQKPILPSDHFVTLSSHNESACHVATQILSGHWKALTATPLHSGKALDHCAGGRILAHDGDSAARTRDTAAADAFFMKLCSSIAPCPQTFNTTLMSPNSVFEFPM